MTIETIGSISAPTLASSAKSPWSGIRKDFRGLENALLNGDLSGAQSAFATLQQAVSSAQGSNNPNSILSQLGQSSSPLGQDLQAISSALGANDLGGAQKAFAKLQQDIESTRQASGVTQGHHGHHGHSATASDGDADDGSVGSAQQTNSAALNTLLQSLSGQQPAGTSASDLMNALQSLANSNPKVAGDLITLINDMNSSGTLVNTKA